MSRSKLSFEFKANACGIFTGKNGSKILCDPWLVDGVFDGSWCHFSKLETSFHDVKNIDAIYLSHIHPDHFDERNFDFDKSIPIIILEHDPNFLIKKLHLLGFKNLIKIQNNQTVNFQEFELTMFAPFVKSNFHESSIGNLIDSALLISCDGISALNANDNMLSVETAQSLRHNFGEITFAMLNYNAAGPYPSCFDNLTKLQKRAESERIIQRNLNHMRSIVRELKPRYVLPFAGSYVIGGNLHFRNEFLGTTTWDICADFLELNNIEPSKTVLLQESNSFDIETGILEKKYIPVKPSKTFAYINTNLAHLKYPYQLDRPPDEEKLIFDIEQASSELYRRMKKFNLTTTFKIIIVAFSKKFQIYPEFKLIENSDKYDKILECSLDERLLRRILDKESHWNNAEIGTHITFFRSPNLYEYDLHTSMQFFHLA